RSTARRRWRCTAATPSARATPCSTLSTSWSPRSARTSSKSVRVVITGASSGIGEALARHYAAQGAVLGLISRRPVTVSNGASYPLDVTDEAALARVARDFIDRFGVPDLVIANAGISSGTSGADGGD